MTNLIITGQRRSGTTFLANLLNSQKDIICYADFVRSPILYGIKNQLKIDDELTSEQINIILSQFYAECGMFDISLTNKIVPDEVKTIKDIVQKILVLLKDTVESNSKVVGFKFTNHPDSLIEFSKHNFKIIYLVRDPRDVMLSSKNRFADHNIYEEVANWKYAVNKFFAKKNKNILIVKYKNLISKNPKTIKDIEEFINVNLNLEKKELQIRNNKNKYTDNSSFGDLKSTFDSNAIFRWKKNKNDKDVLIANQLLEKEIKSLDYPELKAKKIPFLKLKLLFASLKANAINKAKKLLT